MKKIIAAALSVLVGAFGYTIVDQAMEDRVTNLESEVIELREEVSRYHPRYTYTTEYDYPSTEVENITTVTESYETTEDSSGIHVGEYLYELSNSRRKFLIREYNNGELEYVPSYRYEPVSFDQKSTSYTIETTEMRKTEVTDGFGNGIPNIYATNEYFLYLTDVTAQWTKTEEETSYSYSYDKDYSQVSQKYVTEKNYITVKYKGYTDPQLAKTKIGFEVYGYWSDYSWKPISVTNNIIDEDGRFEFEAIYCRESYLDSFYIGSITIK